MKLTLDITRKEIQIDEQVVFGELVKTLDSLLPKGGILGHWKGWSVKVATSSPFIITYDNPFLGMGDSVIACTVEDANGIIVNN